MTRLAHVDAGLPHQTFERVPQRPSQVGWWGLAAETADVGGTNRTSPVGWGVKTLVGTGAAAHNYMFSASNTLWHPGDLPTSSRSVVSVTRVEIRLSNEIQTPDSCPAARTRSGLTRVAACHGARSKPTSWNSRPTRGGSWVDRAGEVDSRTFVNVLLVSCTDLLHMCRRSPSQGRPDDESHRGKPGQHPSVVPRCLFANETGPGKRSGDQSRVFACEQRARTNPCFRLTASASASGLLIN